MIRFASLGSGSSGNALVVQRGTTTLLVDCGFRLRETEIRLARIGLTPRDLTAILITHEHGDHIGSSATFSRRHGLPVHMTPGTRIAARTNAYPRLREFHTAEPFSIGELEVRPFTVPHDAREPAQFVFSDGALSLALLTDAGHVTEHMIRAVNGADALLIECNHDPEMLATGPYPPALRARIAGPYGHLPNSEATRILCSIDRPRLQHAIGMHLSSRTNSPDLARRALAEGLGCKPEDAEVASQDEGFHWRELRQ